MGAYGSQAVTFKCRCGVASSSVTNRDADEPHVDSERIEAADGTVRKFPQWFCRAKPKTGRVWSGVSVRFEISSRGYSHLQGGG